MIRLSLPALVFVYAAVFIAGIFVVWVSYELVRRARDRRALRGRLKCAVCGMEFSDASKAELPRCPGCGSLTERDKVRAF